VGAYTDPVTALRELGWTDARGREFDALRDGAESLFPARVAVAFNHHFRVYVEGEEWEAMVAGRLKHRVAHRAELPVVGDWVVVRRRPGEDRASIVAVLPRASAFSRKEAGDLTGQQVVAANIDVVFIVTALDADFSPRRVERYLLLTREGGARPVVLLTKPDLCVEVARAVVEMTAVLGDAPLHVVNPRTAEGLEAVRGYVDVGRTAALLGSSGVGKSTIVNRLVGQDVRRTQEVRATDAKGRHTTTHRELILLPGGGVLVDTPGMREVQLWEGGEGAEQTFDDIEIVGTGCHFSDCRHRGEPRCAVAAAVASGSLSEARLTSYHALHDELVALSARQDMRARTEQKRRAKVATKALTSRLRQKQRF
jgi:ribosome biogenesis GTPase